MKLFQPYPILVTLNKEPYEILEYALTPLEEFNRLIIQSAQDTSITLKEIIGHDLLTATIPAEWGMVNFHYYSGKELVTQTLVNLEEQFFLTLTKKEEYDTFEDLLFLVRSEMDSLRGTIEENAHHTKMLNLCTIETSARSFIMAKIKNILIRFHSVPASEIEHFTYEIFSHLYGLGPIQELDDNPEIGEIMVNAVEFPEFRCDIYYIKDHKKYRHDLNFRNIAEVERVFNNCIAFENRQLNAVDNSHVEANRPNKDRVNILIPPSTESWALNIRKFSYFTPDKASMKEKGTLDDFMDTLFEVLVQGKANLGIGGPMGTGKTTLINFLLTYTPPIERKMVISSVSETDIERVLKGHDIIIGTVHEEKGITFEKLLKASLRTTSSRVIIPESRGEEFKSLYEANLKTKGNMFTAHAIDDKGFIEACVDMYLSNPHVNGETAENIRNKLVNGIDIVIMMRLAGEDIRVKSISEVTATEDGNYDKLIPLYEFVFDPEKPSEGHYQRTENRLSNKLKTRLNEMGVPLSKLKNL